MILDIRDSIIDIASEIIDSYWNEADQDAAYPYAVFEFRKTREADGVIYGIVEYNLWDSYDTYSRVEKLSYELNRRFQRENIMTESCLIRILSGYTQNVDDPDKKIKRTQNVYDVNIFERK